jgi:uncharacterized sulfatase
VNLNRVGSHGNARGDLPVARSVCASTREGLHFRNAFAPAPGCSPTRASLLTGRHIWQLENAGTHASSFPKKYAAFPDLLEQAGYFVGMTGKGWGPGNWEVSGRARNPAGTDFSRRTNTPPHKGILKNDGMAERIEILMNEAMKLEPFVIANCQGLFVATSV